MTKKIFIRSIPRAAATFVVSLAFFLWLVPGAAEAQGNEIRILESGARRSLVEVITTDYWVEPSSGTSGEYSRVRAPGLGLTGQRGQPALPAAGFLVGIPIEGRPTVQVLEQEWTALNTGPLQPHPTPREQLTPDRRQVNWDFIVDPQIYRRDAFFPSILAEVEPLGLFRDQRIARVRVQPFRYNPVKGQLKVCRRLVLEVSYPAQPSAKPKTDLPQATSPEAERVLSAMLINSVQAKSWRLKRATENLLQTGGPAENAPLCKITVSKNGLYSISPQELLDAGLNLSNIDPRTFQMSNKGRAVPIYVSGEKDGSFDEGDAIEFYGQANAGDYLAEYEDIFQDPYDDRNAYWLSWELEPGLRMVEEDGGIHAADPRKPICYEQTVHAEENNYRDHLNKQLDVRDHWFWDSGISAQQLKSYPLNLTHPDRDSPLRPRVRVMLHGLTTSSEHDPDHHVLVYLNEHLVADRTWDGQDKLLIDSADDGFEFTSSAVLDGENALNLICPGDTEAGAIDRVLLNWIEVDYPRLYRADEDVLEFSKPSSDPSGLYQFTLQGFSSSTVWIYKLGTSVMVNGQGEWIEGDGAPQYQVTFQDEIFDQQVRYLALTPAAKKKVTSIELRSISNLKASGQGADMVIIVHPDFHEHILPLAQHRQEQGMQVAVVEIDEIYDQFSYGLRTPEAIREFLSYAYRHWTPSPLYVLLVGDGSWDYKDTMDLGQNYIPPIMTQISDWGATPCDNLYACVSGDDELPDLFIGRLPVQNNGQLDAIVDKIIRAESEPEWGDWRRRLLFICGTGTHGAQFRSQSETLIQSYVPPEYLTSRVYAYSTAPATDPYHGGTQDLIDALDQGVSFANYIGHGGGGIWSDAGLMRLEDVDRLHTTRQWPAVASMTCFTAAFDEPKRDCLGERLLLAEEKGVVGFWGATGLGWLYGDYYIDRELMTAIFTHGLRTFGQAVTEAKWLYAALYSGQISRDLVNEYILLGDPAIKLSLPERAVNLTLAPGAVNPGDTLRIDGSTPGQDHGQVQTDVLDGDGNALWSSPLSIVNGRFQAQVQIPADSPLGDGTVRCYYWDEQNLTDGAGAASFSLGRVFFDTVYTDPGQPTGEDTVHVWAGVSAAQGIDSVFCLWRAGSVENRWPMALQQTENLYRTCQPLPPTASGITMRYRIIVRDPTGLATFTPQYVYKIPSAADLRIPQAGIVPQGQAEVGIALEVENIGETRAEDVLIRVTVTSAAADPMTKEAIIAELPPSSQTSLFLPWDLVAGTYQVLAEADPEDAISEDEEENNTAEAEIQMTFFNVTPELGTMAAGQHAPAYSLDGNLACDIPAGAISQHQILTIQPTSPMIQNQPDLSAAKMAGGEPMAYRLCFLDSAAALTNPPEVTLTFQLDSQDSLVDQGWDKLAVFRWNDAIERWIHIEKLSWLAADSVAATVSGLGLVCAMINGDQTPPTIEITVEEQHFAEGALVSDDAKIVAVIQDANGIDSQEHQIEVQHNGTAVDANKVVCSPESDKNTLPVSYSSRLSTGRHTVSFSAYDCNGNHATKSVEFKVIDSFGIDQIGNYPNPFEDETVFAYRITGPSHAEEISLKIYTVSGRLMKSFHDFLDDFGRPGTQLDYHALTWDGRDEDGNRLANGVYFYKIRAKWEERTVEQLSKLAILR